ncbi:hypothetical protein SUDANB95_06776 [Actinosynnema sp. ALI-1.44]
MRRFLLVLSAVLPVALLGSVAPAVASSSAVATGNSTVDGRPVLWKNRDHWSTPDGWKVIPHHYTADGSRFGSGDTYSARFDYAGATAHGSSGRDQITGMVVPWAGANVRGLGLVQVDGATLKSTFASAHNFAPSQDANGITQGYLNHLILSRAEHVDEVEQILRATNNGGGFNGSRARNTATIITVFDRWANAATFEVDGDSFARDNVKTEYVQHPVTESFFTPHYDDKDSANPANGGYHGYDWRTNFTKIRSKKPNGFPYFVDGKTTVVEGNKVVNTGVQRDGIHDWTQSTSAVKRHTRAGIRMDAPPLIDYKYFIQKNTGRGSEALPDKYYITSLSKNIGDLPYSGQKPTGWHLNRFVSTFGTVITGSKPGDPYEGKLTTMWVALGEPTVSVFVPLFPYAGTPPAALNDMYLEINKKRKLVYDYSSDDSCGYSCGRNADHSIDPVALTGGDSAGYYGEGGIQKYAFAIENWAYGEYDKFISELRNGNLSDSQLKQKMTAWQEHMATTMKALYVNGTTP